MTADPARTGCAAAPLTAMTVDVFCGDMLEAAELAATGEIRLIAVLAPQRIRGRFAQVPTAREQGVDLVWPTVRGVYMGPGVPDRDFAEWSRTFRRIMARPEFQRLLDGYGLQPQPMVGAELDAYVAQEAKRLAELARSLNLRVP